MADDYRQRCADAAMNAWSMHAVVCDHSQTIPVGNLVDAVLAVENEVIADLNDLITQERTIHEQTIQEVARLRAGEADELPPPGTNYTPAQWIRRWNQATPEERLARAEHILADAVTASRCFAMDHAAELDDLRAAVGRDIAIIGQLRQRADAARDLHPGMVTVAWADLITVRRADLDLVMNHAGDPATVAEYPAAAQRIQDAIAGGRPR